MSLNLMVLFCFFAMPCQRQPVLPRPCPYLAPQPCERAVSDVHAEAVHAKNALVLDEAVRTDSTAAQPTSVNGIQRASEDPKVSAAASSGGTVVGDLEISTPAPERSRAEALVPSNLPTRLPQLPTQVILAPPPPAVALPDPGPFRAPQTLSSSCRFVVDRCQMDSHLMAAEKFDQIYARNGWGSRISELGTHTRSGLGSDLKGAFDWISGLNKFFNQNPELQIIADIPSGDIGWQMAVRHLNTAKLYFGGDIARSVAESNAKRFKDHANKVLQHWDLHSCGAPQWYTSCDSTRHPFDVIMIRDALQHIPILKVQQILHKVILESGAKWLITSSYPESDTLHHKDTAACHNDEKLFCSKGAMRNGDGGWYPIALDCAPFLFPPPAVKTPSHSTFPIEHDFMYIYRIDDALKDAVRKMRLCHPS